MNSDPPITALFSFILWTLCVAVGVIGLLMPHPIWQPPSRASLPPTRLIDVVQLTHANVASPVAATPAAAPQSPVPPPPPAPLPDTPPSPTLAQIAEPPAVHPIQAPPVATPVSTPIASPAPPPPRQIILGQGQGQNIAPEYPYEARIEQQQGLVLIRFTVGRDGNVAAVTAVEPCPYPLLNEEALRAVRDGGPFSPGLYEVRINFALTRR